MKGCRMPAPAPCPRTRSDRAPASPIRTAASSCPAAVNRTARSVRDAMTDITLARWHLRFSLMRYLCIDLGGKRTGLAAGDDETGVVCPVGIIEAAPGPALLGAIDQA